MIKINLNGTVCEARHGERLGEAEWGAQVGRELVHRHVVHPGAMPEPPAGRAISSKVPSAG